MASIIENFRKAAKLRGYNLNDAAKYFGVSASNLSKTLRSGSKLALEYFEKIRNVEYKEMSLEHRTSGDINSGQVISYKLPEEGKVLRQEGDILRVIKHLNETDAIVDVQYGGKGPWYRKEITIKPHNRLNWTGLWEATGATKGRR